MLKRNDIVSSINIWDLTSVIAGSKYENTLNDLQSITIDVPVFTTIKQIILDEFDQQEAEVIQVVQNITSTWNYTLPNVLLESIIGLSISVPNIGPEIIPTGTVDPDNVSSNDANLINWNLTDLCYNNISPWSANKSLPWIDLWSSVAIGIIELYRRDPAYLSNDFSIQGSNDGTTWTDVVTNQQSTSLGLQQIPVSWTYRYWRLFNITGTNATYVVLSEMKAFGVWVWSTIYSALNNREIELKQSGSDVIITNNINSWYTFF